MRQYQLNVQYEKYQTEDMQKKTKTKAQVGKGESLAYMHTIHVEIHVYNHRQHNHELS